MKFIVLSIATLFLLATAVGPVLAADATTDGSSSAGERDLSKSVTDGDSPRGQAGSRAGFGSKDADRGAMQPAGLHKATDLVGQKVVARNGEELGSIENLIIDEDGQVHYVVLSEGGILGVGGKLIPVPWQAANLRMRDDQLTAGIDKQQLQNAPSIEDENLAQIASPAYEQRIHGYFGSTPPGAAQQSQPGSMNRSQPENRSGHPGRGSGSGMGGGSGHTDSGTGTGTGSGRTGTGYGSGY